MNLTINKGGHISDRKEIHINGKAVETDGLTDATVIQTKGKPAQLILTYDIYDLYIDELVVKPYKNLSGLISAAESSSRSDINPDTVTAGMISANIFSDPNINHLSELYAEQTAEELRRSFK